MSKSDQPPERANSFDEWIVDEYRRSEGFTALVVLVAIGELAVSPLRSTYFHVIGEDLDWQQMRTMLNGAGTDWNAVVFSPLAAEDGGPVPDTEARTALRSLCDRIVADRLTINDAHFFDAMGRRLQIEEAQPQ